MVKNLLVLLMCLSLFGCVTTSKIEPIKMPKAEFTKTEKFELKETITKPPKPVYTLLDENFNTIDNPNDAKFIAFTPTEFAKIVALSKSFDSQSEMNNELILLVNLRIQEINALKELIATKELLNEHLAILYANEQNMRQYEQRDYEMKTLWGKVTFVIQSGVIIALALAL